jgi:hypothetical protein
MPVPEIDICKEKYPLDTLKENEEACKARES